MNQTKSKKELILSEEELVEYLSREEEVEFSLELTEITNFFKQLDYYCKYEINILTDDQYVFVPVYVYLVSNIDGLDCEYSFAKYTSITMSQFKNDTIGAKLYEYLYSNKEIQEDMRCLNFRIYLEDLQEYNIYPDITFKPEYQDPYYSIDEVYYKYKNGKVNIHKIYQYHLNDEDKKRLHIEYHEELLEQLMKDYLSND